MDTKILKHGTPARLFPVLPEAKKEERTLSIVLATAISVRPFAHELFSDFGVRVGKRSKVSCYTEVTLTNEIKGLKDRPDALVVVETGKNSWSALVEAKIGRNSVETEQLDRYIELAQANAVDAVITITNELTPDPNITPTKPTRNIGKRLSLYHISWASILTKAFLLASNDEDPFENDDEVFLVSELIRYLEHDGSGREPLDQMNKEWPKIVGDVVAGHPLNPSAEEIKEMVTMWHQEARDVALIMTRKLNEPVCVAKSKSKIKDSAGWVENEVKRFCDEKLLSFDLDVPNAASKIAVEADFRRRTVKCTMKLLAPSDRKSNSAKLNWLLRQLQKSDLSKIIITCITHGRGQNFGAMAHEIEPNSDEIKNLSEIVSFQIEMSADLGKYFNSRKKFVENLERHIPYFYENVGENLKAFVPRPPKLKSEITKNSDDSRETVVDSEANSSDPPSNSSAERPNWTAHWQLKN